MLRTNALLVLGLAIAAYASGSPHANIGAPTTTSGKQQVLDYLKNVYTAPSDAQWAALPDYQLFALYNNLTMYFPGNPSPSTAPRWGSQYPNGRVQSHPYAGTVCNCLHIQLEMCKPFSPTSTCAYWPYTTYLNMDYVEKFHQGFPDNSWFEGLSYPGEWAFPASCQNSNLMDQVYGFNNHVWLYPITGFGVWWNTGRTASAPNKVAWLLKYGIGQTANGVFLGNNETEIMTTLATTTCPNFLTRTNSNCDDCSYANTGSTSKCCCHGSGFNLGTQIITVQQNDGSTLMEAVEKVAGFYKQGLFGQQDPWSAYPEGTFFCYRNLLDPYFISIQASQPYDSVQFTREPQHSGGSGTPADPAYAFEFLMAKDSWQYNWGTMCASDSLAVLNPLDHIDTYTINGYIPASAVKKTASIQTWNATPGYTQLVQVGNPTFSANNGDLGMADDSGNHVSVTVAVLSTLGIAVVVVGTVIAVVGFRRRQRKSHHDGRSFELSSSSDNAYAPLR